MNCRDWEEQIALHAERDLPPREAAETERHLAECAECREFAEGITQSLALLRGAHAEPLVPAHFAAVRARVMAQLPEQRRPAWRLAWIGGLAVAAAFVAVLVVEHQPAPPPRVAVARPPAAEALEIPLPAVEEPAPKRVRKRVPLRRAPARRAEPIMVKLITDDPDVVIYWIAE